MHFMLQKKTNKFCQQIQTKFLYQFFICCWNPNIYSIPTNCYFEASVITKQIWQNYPMNSFETPIKLYSSKQKHTRVFIRHQRLINLTRTCIFDGIQNIIYETIFPIKLTVTTDINLWLGIRKFKTLLSTTWLIYISHGCIVQTKSYVLQNKMINKSAYFIMTPSTNSFFSLTWNVNC